MKTFTATVYIDVSNYRDYKKDGNVPNIFVWSGYEDYPLPTVAEGSIRYKCLINLPDHREEIKVDVFPEQVQVERTN